MHGLSGMQLGTVRLTVSDLDRSQGFYEDTLGLVGRDNPDGTVALFAARSDESRATAPPLVELHGDPEAPSLDSSRPGLFHFAILVPSRRHLAEALMRLAASRWELDGASDHLVSEALYLSDPDGNGIEIYRDRPREQWPHDAAGRLQMATLPLDLRGLAGELQGEPGANPGRAHPDTRIGHVHLQVADIPTAESFYVGALGLDATVRGYPGALFVSADGYHHHLGLNTWHSRGGTPPAPGSVGLRDYEILLPDAEQLKEVRERLSAVGAPIVETPGGFVARDPNGIATRMRLATVPAAQAPAPLAS